MSFAKDDKYFRTVRLAEKLMIMEFRKEYKNSGSNCLI